MKIYIYTIWFPTSKKYYVGQTYSLDKRMREHLHSGSTVCKALWKYDDWQVSILHTCKTRDEANRIEIEEIRNFNSVAPNGYNLTRGGDGLFSPSEETRKKLSEARRNISEETRRKMSESHKGIHPSEETRKKLSKIRKNFPEEVRKKFGHPGNQHLKGFKPSIETKSKLSVVGKGNQNAKGHKQSKRSRIKKNITQLRNSISKLEQELESN